MRFFAAKATTPHKLKLSNTSGLDQYNISIDYLPNTVDRKLGFDLNIAPVEATILINSRHLSGVVKLTRINNTFNGYNQLTKVSSTSFYTTQCSK